MGRILFFMLLAFLIFMALRIIAGKRKPSAPPQEIQDAPETTPVQALLPCPLCAEHMLAPDIAGHLKQAHGATNTAAPPGEPR